MNENVIEWLKGQKTVTITLTSGSKFANKLIELNKTHDEIDVRINEDGSVFAHVPLKWIKISPPRKMSDEQRAIIGERLKASRSRSVMRRETMQKEEK